MRLASEGDALAWMIEHAILAWTEQGAQFHDYADFERDGYRCTAPGCTGRAPEELAFELGLRPQLGSGLGVVFPLGGSAGFAM